MMSKATTIRPAEALGESKTGLVSRAATMSFAASRVLRANPKYSVVAGLLAKPDDRAGPNVLIIANGTSKSRTRPAILKFESYHAALSSL